MPYFFFLFFFLKLRQIPTQKRPAAGKESCPHPLFSPFIQIAVLAKIKSLSPTFCFAQTTLLLAAISGGQTFGFGEYKYSSNALQVDDSDNIVLQEKIKKTRNNNEAK